MDEFKHILFWYILYLFISIILTHYGADVCVVFYLHYFFIWITENKYTIHVFVWTDSLTWLSESVHKKSRFFEL